MKSLCAEIAASLLAIKGERSQIRQVVGCVEGSFILENALNRSECELIMTAVRNLNEYAEKQLQLNPIVNDHQNSGLPSSKTTESKHPSDASDGGTAILDTNLSRNRNRRHSQHHTPCYVDNIALAGLTSRILPYLPHHAGPENTSVLNEFPISTFLRCYDYHTSDSSTPHFDRSFNFHEKDALGRNCGRILQFTAYSVLLYLNDDFEGGHTTFFPLHADSAGETAMRSRRGNTSLQEVTADTPRVSIKPRQGDILIFPHGRHLGCYPDPLHEGSTILSGRKTIIRTDLIYNNSNSGQKKRRRSTSTATSTAEVICS